MYRYGKYIDVVLKEMCSRVKVGLEEVGQNEDNKHWYSRHEWTLEEEHDFEKWLANYLYNNTAARKAICYSPIKRKRYLMGVAKMFTFRFGWKLTERG